MRTVIKIQFLFLLIVSCKPPYHYTRNGGIRPNKNNFFSYKKYVFKLLDTLSIDTNSVYIKHIGYIEHPVDKHHTDSTMNAHVYFRFYSSGKLKVAICDSFPSTKEINDISTGGVGYFIIDKEKIKIQYIANNGTLIKKTGEIKNNDLILYDPIGKVNGQELFKKTKISGLTHKQPDW